MKKYYKAAFSAIVYVLLFATSYAQENEEQVIHKTPRWVCENGYWVAVSNIKTPEKAVVYFYNNQGEMVYKEALQNGRLNFDKRKIKIRLKKVLETAIVAWNEKRPLNENEQILALLFR